MTHGGHNIYDLISPSHLCLLITGKSNLHNFPCSGTGKTRWYVLSLTHANKNVLQELMYLLTLSSDANSFDSTTVSWLWTQGRKSLRMLNLALE